LLVVLPASSLGNPSTLTDCAQAEKASLAVGGSGDERLELEDSEEVVEDMALMVAAD
jgi:hypothetical protein